MNVTSKTGLLASSTNYYNKKSKQKSIQLKAITIPAPVVLRPYAGLYNPFPYGCSLLCNHPTDKEAKDVLKRARETWATENKNIILPDEIQAIREGLSYVEESKPPPPIESIPEELFRRYTETDSRPLTPAPTLASIKTRGSSSRRCVTPDPVINSVLRERTLLILDLRRSHSQEIISWHEANDPPVINILQAPTPSVSVDSTTETPEVLSRKETAKSQKSIPSPKNSPKQKLEVPKIHPPPQPTKVVQNILTEQSDGEEEVIKRKGKRRKKRGRDSSRGPLAVQASIDPETQVSALGTDANNLSARSTLIPGGSVQDANNTFSLDSLQEKDSKSSNSYKSILEPYMLKHLQRELTIERLDHVFDEYKRATLEEAFKALPFEKKPPSEEMILLKKELKLNPTKAELWLSLPRVFSRRSARFEIPLHSNILSTLSPLKYLQEHVMVSNSRRLLYNLVFNRHKDKKIDNHDRTLCKDRIQIALGEMMGKPLTDDQMLRFKNLVNWKDEDIIDFKTWCGMCALFERIFAGEFCRTLPGKDVDPCNEVEVADFLSLSRRLQYETPDECLLKILNAIKDL